MKRFFLSIIITLVGVSWLLVVLDMVPDLHWIWTIGLFLSGLLVMGLCGLDKLTFSIGAFLMVGGVFSILRTQGMISLEVELPVLVISFGALMGLSELLPLKPPQLGRKKNEEAAEE